MNYTKFLGGYNNIGVYADGDGSIRFMENGVKLDISIEQLKEILKKAEIHKQMYDEYKFEL